MTGTEQRGGREEAERAERKKKEEKNELKKANVMDFVFFFIRPKPSG
jgi:hypothetical protein